MGRRATEKNKPYIIKIIKWEVSHEQASDIDDRQTDRNAQKIATENVNRRDC